MSSHSPVRSVLHGVLAGAAGTTALNAATYLDMVVQGRGASSTPEQTVEQLSRRTGVAVPGDDDARSNRTSGLGALTGIGAGLAAGAVYGALRGAGWRPGLLGGTAVSTAVALLAGNVPMTALGVTDPRTWPVSSWVSDVVPHLAYGVVTAAAVAALERP